MKTMKNLQYCMPPLLAFAIPLSTALTSVAAFTMVLLWLIEGDHRQKWGQFWQHPLSPLLTLFFCWGLISCLYSIGTEKHILDRVNDALRLFCIPILIGIVQDLKVRRNTLYAFLAAMTVTLVFGALKLYGGLEIGAKYTKAAVFRSHIDTNFFMVLAAFYTLNLARISERATIPLIALGSLMLYFVFFMCIGRIGYIGALLLVSYFLWVRYSYKGLFYALLCILSVGFLLYLSSASFAQRIDVLSLEWDYYLQGKLVQSSLGSRIQFYHSSLLLILERPWFGWGAGSFGAAYQELSQGAYLFTDNPHNEFFRIGVELGLVGFILWIALLYKQWQLTCELEDFEKLLVRATLLLFLVGCLFNSWLIDTAESYFYIILSALAGYRYPIMRPGDLVMARLH